MKKSVAILAFGPSLFQRKYEVHGEVWSMNTCYDLFARDINSHLLKSLTRIFEMHQPAKREGEYISLDKKPHYWHLDQMCRAGVRIVMCEPHPQVLGSEAYPLKEIEEHLGAQNHVEYWGRDFWGGTPPYCLAMALYEGYNDIHLVGCDCLDPKHVRQQRPMNYLMGWAAAKGITVTGVTVNSGKSAKRYGYDYGPEWDDEQNAELFDGWPVEIRFKGI